MRWPLLLATVVLCSGGPVFSETTPTNTGHPGRVLHVDRNGSGAYRSLAEVAKIVRPGDTISIKPGSGPYRETLAIRTSGTAELPITVDGGGNLVTGFEPLTTWEEKDGVISTALPSFPRVLTYKGERLLQDFTTGQFTNLRT